MQELIDVEGDGMADMVFRCIQEMDIDNRMMVCGTFHCNNAYLKDGISSMTFVNTWNCLSC